MLESLAAPENLQDLWREDQVRHLLRQMRVWMLTTTTGPPKAPEGDTRMDILFCEVCEADASATVIIARWHDANVCTDCLAVHEQIQQEEQQGDPCECLDCLRWQRKQREAHD
jgi:hypothetical protein